MVENVWSREFKMNMQQSTFSKNTNITNWVLKQMRLVRWLSGFSVEKFCKLFLEIHFNSHMKIFLWRKIRSSKFLYATRDKKAGNRPRYVENKLQAFRYNERLHIVFFCLRSFTYISFLKLSNRAIFNILETSVLTSNDMTTLTLV